MIFLAAPELTSSQAVDESMKSITKYVCNTLECDRATVYSLDHEAGVLWSQVAKGEGKSFTIPLGSGVSGYAAQQNKVVNIRNAYSNPKFDQTYDKATGYTTETILCMPIRNRLGFPDGVIQAINKCPDKDGSKRIFSKIDEGILEMMGRMAGLFLKNTLSNKKQTTYFHTLR